METYFHRKVIGPPFEGGEEMKYEGVRLTTFTNWPKRSAMSPIRLAKAGLFYTGAEDQVACFCCSGRLKIWEAGDSPVTKHKRVFPRCRFVTGRGTMNVPLGDTTETLVAPLGRHDNHPSDVPLQDARDVPDRAQNCGSDRRNKYAYYCEQAARVRNQRDGPTSLSCRTNEIDQRHPYSQCESLPSSSARQAPRTAHRTPKMLAGGTPILTDRMFNTHDLQDMKLEGKRLDSFIDWPHLVLTRKENLAEAGFYYLGLADRVKCAFCNGILRNLEPGDKPMVEHRKFFPNCAFVRDSRAAGNVTIKEENAIPQQAPQNVASNPALSSRMGIMTERPAHQKFAVESARLTSFNRWRGRLSPYPEDLAKAGFFYTGLGDNVKCFFCDGGLCNWESGDDPWWKHARCFPRCNYVRTVKGEEFILRIHASSPGQSNATSSTANMAGTIGHGDSSGTRRFPVEPRVVKACLDTSKVQSVLEMGFPRKLLDTVIHNRLATTGDDFPNVESLLEAVFTETDASPGSSSSNQQHHNSASAAGAEFGNTAATATTAAAATTTIGTTPFETATAAGNATKEHVSSKEATRSSTDAQQLQCKICLDDEANILFLPCGHLSSCARCAPALRNCAICRSVIKGMVRVYMS